MQADFNEEKRLAVVMYGGVSLAIYIAGVARELLGVVRATAPSMTQPDQAGLSAKQLNGVEEIYRELASRDGVLTTRVTIDIISGTSAGGINGVFLAKALAHNLSLDPIIDLWVKEGDLAKLLNDSQAATGTTPPPNEPPVSLLNGGHLYRRLLAAFDQMDEVGTTGRYDPSRVDLFVTTTDVHGELIRLPVLNAVAREKRHRQRFHFTARGDPAPVEFARAENPLLAFASRCTSSFPAAFEPFTWNDAVSIEPARPGSTRWTDRLLFTGADYANRPFIDGGVLDNKPFSLAIDELARRQSALPVSRTVMYVEPDPEKFDLGRQQRLQGTKPDAAATVFAALTLPGYETIREDLERVLERNERAAQLQTFEQAVADALEAGVKAAYSASEWKESNGLKLTARYGMAYGAYHQLKIATVLEALSGAICAAVEVTTPEHAGVLQELATLWIRARYPLTTGDTALMLDADVEYRLRKLSFVLRALQVGGAPEAAARKVVKAACDALYKARRDMRGVLGPKLATLRTGLLSDAELARLASQLPRVREQSLVHLAVQTATEAQAALTAGLGVLIDAFKKASTDVWAQLGPLPATHPARTRYENFEHYDMALFPIVRNGGVDEAVNVDVVRISPDDAKVKRAEPLAGNSLGHFGAFLEEQRRHHDVLCGRLDGAEIIIRQLGGDDLAVARAHGEIVHEMLKPWLVERHLKLGSPLPPQILAVLDDKPKLLQFFRDGAAYDLGLDRAHQVDSMGRAGVIIEKMMRSWAQEKDVPLPKFVRWGVWALATLGQVAIPRSIPRTVATYWGRLFGLGFGLMALGGYLSGQDQLLITGAKGLGLLSVLGVARLFLASAIGDRPSRFLARVLTWVTPVAALAAGVQGKALHVASRLPPVDMFFLGLLGLAVLISCAFGIWLDVRRVRAWVMRRAGPTTPVLTSRAG